MKNYKWNGKPKYEEGVIVGCTQEQEWLLPWWWMNFRLHSNHPVTFFNFGNMTEKGINWCRNRGEVILLDLPDNLFTSKDHIDPKKVQEWEKTWWHGAAVWDLRILWYKKIFTFLNTPYRKTVWLDLDCQVRGSINPLFSEYLKTGFGISAESDTNQDILRQKGVLLPNEVMYNSGVISFTYGSQIVQDWLDMIIDHNQEYMADQQLLTRMLYLKKPPFDNIPLIYNWAPVYGDNPQAVIIHWWGPLKSHLAEFIKVLHSQCSINLAL